MEEDRTRQEQEQKKMAGRPETQQNSPHSRRLPMPGGKDPDRGEEEQEPVVDTGFMQEKIKARPVNHRKILRRTLGTAGLAVLFGGVACLVFLVMEPVISRLLYPDEHKVQEVTFSEDGQTADSAAGSSLETEEINPEDMIQNDSDLASSAASAAAEKAADEAARKAAKAAAEAVDASGENLDQEIGQVIDSRAYTAADYQKIYGMLNDTATEASKSVVVVTRITADSTWYGEEYENSGKAPGLIVAEHEKQILILCEDQAVQGADEITVTFPDGTLMKGQVVGIDTVSGYAVVGVDGTKISDSARQNFAVAELGSSKQSNLTGTPVIALGAPAGTVGSVSYGIVTSTSTSLDVIDASYKLLTTDIYGSSAASGVLINLSGQVLGIIDMDYNGTDMKNMISAVGITDMKPLIGQLSNGEKPAYLGIHGADVPENVTKEQGVPQGAYVRKVEEGSPAMAAGVISGDVITEFDGTSITTWSELLTKLRSHQPGDDVTLKVQRTGNDGYQEETLQVSLQGQPGK